MREFGKFLYVKCTTLTFESTPDYAGRLLQARRVAHVIGALRAFVRDNSFHFYSIRPHGC